MATLATQTGIFMIPWITLLQVVIIGAENLDPVYFSFSANNPKTTSLIPLPKHFDKLGGVDNDCCTLALFFEVKDLDMGGSGNDAPEMEGAQAQTGTGQATFKFEHPHIRDTDKIFTMDVAMDKVLVKSRHILNFDNCSSIIYKTFNILAATSITDEKDVKVILVNGKDKNIPCQVPHVPHVPHTSKPVSNTYSNSTETPVLKAELSQLTVGLAIVACVLAFGLIGCIIAIILIIKWVKSKLDKYDTQVKYQNETFVSGGADSDNQVKSRSRGIKQNEEKCLAGSNDSDDDQERCPVKGGDGQLQKAETCKKILIITAIVLCFLLVIISVVAILTT